MYPPPDWMNLSKTACCFGLSTSPVVFRKTTAWYFLRFSSLNAYAFSVVSTVNPFSFPNCMMAVFPTPMDPCLKPAVFEKTNTLDCALATKLKQPFNNSNNKTLLIMIKL